MDAPMRLHPPFCTIQVVFPLPQNGPMSEGVDEACKNNKAVPLPNLTPSSRDAYGLHPFLTHSASFDTLSAMELQKLKRTGTTKMEEPIQDIPRDLDLSSSGVVGCPGARTAVAVVIPRLPTTIHLLDPVHTTKRNTTGASRSDGSSLLRQPTAHIQQ